MESTASGGIHIRLLGRPAGWLDADGKFRTLEKRKAALFAYVALHGQVSVREVIEHLWDGKRVGFNQARSELHKAMGQRPFTTDTPFGFNLGVSCDLQENLANWQIPELLSRAILLEGEEIEGDAGVWLENERVVWLARICDTVVERDKELHHVDWLPRALRLAERLTRLAPNHEAGWRACMWLHYVMEDLKAARKAHDRLIEALDGRSADPHSKALWRVVHSALETSLSTDRANPALRHPPFVGRQTEGAAIEDAAAMRQPFLLRGEVGIGKSRLLKSCFAQRGPSIIVTALSSHHNVPYATLVRLLVELDEQYGLCGEAEDRRTLSAIVPHWRSTGTAVQTDAVALQSVVRRLLCNACDKGVRSIGLDDLHHCDTASLEMWHALAEDAAYDMPLFGFTCLVGTGVALLGVLNKWRSDSPPLKVIELRSFAVEDVGELLTKLALVGPSAALNAVELHARVGGNPRVLLETLCAIPREWQQGAPLPLPSTAAAVFERRVRNLPSRAWPLLRVLAVLGPDGDHAEQALGCSAREFETWRRDLEEHGVLLQGRFENDSMHEVALASLSDEDRKHAHDLVATVLMQNPRVAKARLAEHWERAERWSEAGAAFQAAARLANDAGRVDEARGFFAKAAACLRRGDDKPGEFAVLYDSLPAELRLQDVRPAMLVVERLQALAATAYQRACVAHAEALRQVSHYSRGDTALKATEQAVALTEPFRDLHADAMGLLSAALAQAGRFGEAVDACQLAVTLAEADGRPSKAREIGTTQVYVCWESNRFTEAQLLCERLIEDYKGANDVAGVAAMEGHLATLLLAVDPVKALPLALSACQGHRETDPKACGPMAVMHRVALARAAMYRGDMKQAVTSLYEQRRSICEGMLAGISAKVRLAQADLWLMVGDDAQALRALGREDESWPPAMQIQRCWALTRIARANGERGVRHLQRIEAIHARAGESSLVHTAWLEWGRCGDAQVVAQQMLQVQHLYEEAGMHAAACTAKLRSIDRLNELEDHASVSTAATLAMELQLRLDDGGALHASTDVPEAWLVLARALARGGHAKQATAAWETGRTWIEQALPLVPEESERGFRERNQINRELLGPEQS